MRRAWSRTILAAGWVAAGVLPGCRPRPGPAVADSTEAMGKDTAIAAPPDHREVVLLIGTSLTAGYGLDPADAWATLIQHRVDSLGLPFQLRNAGVSGETSSGARDRLSWLLSQGPFAVVVVETGANDGLRGLPLDVLRSNLDTIMSRLQALAPRPAIVLAGMEAPPNLGARFTTGFRAIFPAVAASHHVHLMPFLLSGVAGVDSLNQPDGIHPNALGSRQVAANVWQTLGPILDSIARQRSTGKQ